MPRLKAFQNASRLSLALGDLRFVLQSEWGSTFHAYRLRIRDDILRTLRQSGLLIDQETESRLLDLEHPPALPGQALSISHCRSLGGYAWLSRPGLIGLDIEEETRLSPQTAARVSTEAECAQAPSSALLWVAKEAAFKALASATHAATVSEIRIADWQPFEAPTDSFRFTARSISEKADPSTLARGFASREDGLAAAVVVANITQST